MNQVYRYRTHLLQKLLVRYYLVLPDGASVLAVAEHDARLLEEVLAQQVQLQAAGGRTRHQRLAAHLRDAWRLGWRETFLLIP